MYTDDEISRAFEQKIIVFELAFEYLSIGQAEMQRTINLVKKKIETQSEFNVSDIFKQENLTSNEMIQQLDVFDAYLQILVLDQQFAKLAIVNKMVSKKKIAQFFDYQQSYFKNYRIIIKIGDIMVQKGHLSRHQQISILLTQNRIENENLLDALNNLGETLPQKDSVNKRFGVLAIKNELVTLDQVNTALALQRTERTTLKRYRFIGQILQETANLTDSQIGLVLKQQTLYEKKYLCLEKALYASIPEKSIYNKLNNTFKYTIAQGGLKASATKIKETNEIISTYEFLIWLKRAGITFGIVQDFVLEEFIGQTKKNSEITVAIGQRAEPGVDEVFSFTFKNELERVRPGIESEELEDRSQKKSKIENPEKEKSNSKASVDDENSTDVKREPGNRNEKAQESIDEKLNKDDQECENSQSGHQTAEDKKNLEHGGSVFVHRGDLLAQITQSKKGKPGKDVQGFSIRPGRPAICKIIAGKGVIKKGFDFFALIDGLLSLKNGIKLVIEPQKKKKDTIVINDPIRIDTESKYETANVILKENILSGGILRCHSLQLDGHMMGRVICSGNIVAAVDIATSEKLRDEDAAHQIEISCNGSIKASKNIINVKLQTKGDLNGYNSTIAGSEVVANMGMTIKNCISHEKKPSILQFGLKPGDKLLVCNDTLQKKREELADLKKEKEVAELNKEFEEELKAKKIHQDEQHEFKSLIKMIEAPELYKHKGLKNKINYLENLPNHSSVKAYYLKLPETKIVIEFLNKVMKQKESISSCDLLTDLNQKIDPEPVANSSGSEIDQITHQYEAKFSELDHEIADNSKEILNTEIDLKNILALKAKLTASLSPSKSVIRIREKCEKGTIIKGKITSLIIKEDMYRVMFSEAYDSQTGNLSITIASR